MEAILIQRSSAYCSFLLGVQNLMQILAPDNYITKQKSLVATIQDGAITWRLLNLVPLHPLEM